jgi:hypothetical protein
MFERLLAYVPFQVIMRRAKRKLELTYNVIGRDDVDLEAHGPASAGSTDLRSMIMFGVNTLHKSGGSNDMETVDDSALGNIVNWPSAANQVLTCRVRLNLAMSDL